MANTILILGHSANDFNGRLAEEEDKEWGAAMVAMTHDTSVSKMKATW